MWCYTETSQTYIHDVTTGDTLRNAGNQDGNDLDPHRNDRPPVFLMPGLASTRLVSWKYKSCANALLSDVKVQDYVWMNINMIIQMATIDGSCFLECMTLGFNQTDMEDPNIGCKLRPEEGLNAIASLAPNSVGSNMLVGECQFRPLDYLVNYSLESHDACFFDYWYMP